MESNKNPFNKFYFHKEIGMGVWAETSRISPCMGSKFSFRSGDSLCSNPRQNPDFSHIYACEQLTKQRFKYNRRIILKTYKTFS